MVEQSVEHTLWEGGPRVASRFLWEVLATQAGLGVVLLDKTGRVLQANEPATNACLGLSVQAVVDRSVRELFPADVADDIHETINRVIQERVQIIRRSVWSGQLVQSHYRAVPVQDVGENLVLITTRLGAAEPEQDDAQIIEPSTIELGKLDILTTRELEVLALLGRGMRIKQIAETLARSPKTIDSHKESIGKKLATTDRAALMQLARDAGLTLDVARLRRVGKESSRARLEGGDAPVDEGKTGGHQGTA